jgi:hypothetical protein
MHKRSRVIIVVVLVGAVKIYVAAQSTGGASGKSKYRHAVLYSVYYQN